MSENLPAWVRESLRCPISGAPLEIADDAGTTVLRTVGVTPIRQYPLEGGIPVLLADRARVIE
ncbi:MAG: Trm112 family protein [Bowdeniella nasicola]|nr:Trm112 family protein [Bowdeniella nasicola]